MLNKLVNESTIKLEVINDTDLVLYSAILKKDKIKKIIAFFWINTVIILWLFSILLNLILSVYFVLNFKSKPLLCWCLFSVYVLIIVYTYYYRNGKPIKKLQYILFFFCFEYFKTSTITIREADKNEYFQNVFRFVLANGTKTKNSTVEIFVSINQMLLLNNEKKTYKHCYIGHPHGIFAIGWATFALNPFTTDLIALIAPSLYYIGQLLLFVISHASIIAKASTKSIEHIMLQNKPFCLLLGGLEEAALCSNQHETYFIRPRSGIFILTYKNDYKLYPVISKGENMLYKCSRKYLNFRLWLTSIKIPAVLFIGQFFTAMPNSNAGIHVIVEKAVDAQKFTSVAEFKAAYIKKLEENFNENEKKYVQIYNSYVDEKYHPGPKKNSYTIEMI